ncbi:MAG: Exoenzymes regulatory protein AepA precursor [uncultured Lysobacter sp.]|uniref:Exoenzymes regulatory protein AepA n=1 Tax=uncultured Lysobacter sp. TaxID=271060 RepID=A0A6J4LEX6_9GAMM|nr:MAG: Exoenzymes regulatory protein AepA precursor [uncultured Lysobacter sp.]
MRRVIPSLVLLALSGASTAAPPARDAASGGAVRVLTAARIHTMDVARPQVEAIAYDASGRIVALGSREALLRQYPKAQRVDAGAATVIPGLIDAHGHVAGLGLTKMRVDLVDTTSKAEVLQRLQAFARELPAGAWLLGRGWDQNDWPEKQFPTAADLDAAFPDRPVWLERVDGHAGWGNTAAMRAVKRDLAGTWQPEGGQVVRDAAGKPSGVFVDAAMQLVEQAIPALDDATAERALALGMQEAVAHGLTGVHDAGVSLADLQRYRRLADRGRMPLRINAMADGDSAALASLCSDGLYRHPSGRLQMRSVKLYIDGALGSRGAAMLEDYSDHAGHRGLMLMKPEALEQVAKKARGCKVQVATHAIGDRGNREVLDVFARVLDKKTDHRWRIEHAQILAPDDLKRFAPLGVIASMQPTHATSDMPWAEERVGPQRITGAYAWRQLRDSGARLALGSDFPVESVDPRLGLFAAATRTDAAGKPAGGWLAQEKLTVFEALRGFTLDAAYAGFAEAEVGSLAVGKRADFVVLTQDPMAVPAEQLRSLTVQATYVDGQPVYEAKAGGAR